MLRFRRVAALFAGLMLCCAGGFAQQTASFTAKTYSAGNMPRDLYAVDVNNDGIPDLIEDTLASGNTISVMIAYGTGNYQAPKTIYTFPTTYQGTVPMVSGDFNGDGNVDLVFALPSDLGCHAPSSPGVNLCSPVTGEKEEETGVVEILAPANVTGKLASMQLWIDGYKQTTESTNTTLHFASFGIGKGTHRIAVLAVNTAGQVWEQAATVNSQ